MRMRLTFGALALAAALGAAPGCSLVLVKGPPRGYQQMASFECTRHSAFPLFDAVMAGISLSVGATLISAGYADTDGFTRPIAVVGAGLAVEGIAWGASALIGLSRTSRCRAAQDAVPKR